MKYLVWILALGFHVSSLSANVKTVVELDKGEPHNAMVFHADHLWVGQSRKNFNADYKVQIFNRKDQLVSEIPLRHAAQFLYPYNTNSVIIVGTGHTPNLTMYTIISNNSGSFPNRTRMIPMEAWAHQWIGTLSGREYFTDPGGNPNDEAVTHDLSLASQTIFRMEGDTPKYLSTRMRLPLGGVIVDKSLFVIQKESIEGTKSNLYQVDPATGKSLVMFSSPRRDLHTITKIPNSTQLAMIERFSNKVLVFDSTKKVLETEVSIDANPKALVASKNCLFVGSFDERSVQILKRNTKGTFEVATKLANPLPENEFKKLFQVAVDETTGRVYARSNMPCNPMSELCDSQTNRVISWDDSAQEIKKLCGN